MIPITPEIIANLAKEDGFGFEMKILRDLRRLNARRLRHGETYVDYRTGVERHFDFQCEIRTSVRRLFLAIECKNLFENSPAVVCGQKRIKTEAIHDVIFSGQGILQGKQRQVFDGAVSEVLRKTSSEFYPCGEFVGKSVFRPTPPDVKDAKPQQIEEVRKKTNMGFTAKSASGEKGYDQWNQAVGSAASMALNLFDNPKRENVAGLYTVVLPIVAVPDGTLWEIEFDEEGENATPARQVDHTTLFRDHRVPRKQQYGTPHYREVTLSHVHFFTAAGLRAWIAAIPNDALAWERVINADLIADVKERFQPGYIDGYTRE
jgi:hypothetical protein